MLFSLIAAAAILFVATTILGYAFGLGLILIEALGDDPKKALFVVIALAIITAAILGEFVIAVVGLAVLALFALLAAL